MDDTKSCTTSKGLFNVEMWFADAEVFPHDTLWVFKRQSDNTVEAFWNDNEGVADFIRMMKPVLCGFNIRDYDAYILKATLLDWSPEQIRMVSDTIIYEERYMVWTLFQNTPFIRLPPLIDLFHDIVPRKGLKEIEANIGMSVVESPVSFEVDRKLTDDERDEVLGYCLHDIAATARLYDLRFDYLKSKQDLCEIRGIDPLTMLQHTNARIVATVLDGIQLPGEFWGETEHYEVPENIDRSAIPEDVLAFAEGIHTYNCEDNNTKVEFLFHDCPTTVGLGGIHAAVPAYKETTSDERVILLQDIGSYYPSLIINNGYMSRTVADSSVYHDFYDMRMRAKAAGDKATAEAAKLVLNTTYGTMKDGFNKRMYDPMQATRVCLSGQLYILDLIEQMFRAVPEGLTLIQLNTDGWIISVPRTKVTTIHDAVLDWKTRTGFAVDTTEVETIIQANVNNYVLRTTEGKVKVKGGVVARYEGGDFKSNSLTIIDKAVVDYLLDGVPIEKTVYDCDDIQRFQLVAKMGPSFQKMVYQEQVVKIGEQTRIGRRKPEPILDIKECQVQRVNRVYATTDEQRGGIFKLKLEDGEEVSRSKVPLTPERCVLDNSNEWGRIDMGLTTLDRAWYVALAERKAKEFITRNKEERELMAKAKEPTNELKEKPPAKKATPQRKTADKTADKTEDKTSRPLAFPEKLLALQARMAGASTGVKFDGVQTFGSKSSEYADTQQYKMYLSAVASACGLIFQLSITASEFLGVITPPDRTPEYGVSVSGIIRFLDADSEKYTEYGATGFGQNVRAGYCEGIAQTNLLRNFILNNFLLDNKGREGDDVAANAAPDQGYVAPERKSELKSEIAATKKTEYATDLFADAFYAKAMEAREVKGSEDFAQKTLDKHFKDGKPILVDGKSTMTKKAAVEGMAAAEEIIAKGEGDD